jgi:hypothetical protein
MSTVDLMDIAPVGEHVVVQGKELWVSGIENEGTAYLVMTFPEVRALLEKRAQEISSEQWLQSSPEVLATVMALGTTDREKFPTQREWIDAIQKRAKIARKLPVHEQLKLVTLVFKYTFPEGVGPFAELVTKLATTLGVQPQPQDPTAPQQQQQQQSTSATLPQQPETTIKHDNVEKKSPASSPPPPLGIFSESVKAPLPGTTEKEQSSKSSPGVSADLLTTASRKMTRGTLHLDS